MPAPGFQESLAVSACVAPDTARAVPAGLSGEPSTTVGCAAGCGARGGRATTSALTSCWPEDASAWSVVAAEPCFLVSGASAGAIAVTVPVEA